MAFPIITIDRLSKRYRLGQYGAGSFRESAGRWLSRSISRTKPVARRQPATDSAELWALRDVSFEVAPGEVLGIIGRNGAGKSTLLKILSRITEPSAGRAVMRGRLASLLEVGTGFHPELTGRENIFLNGAMLGMRKAEIARKLDEIVAFSEVERFIDTPVKHYSSGMYVRLAFAVAAHLDPEIIVVDEVLAVGDAAFQKKCLGKMQDVAGQGRTVLFVSHNMTTIRNLCSRTIWLEQGAIRMDGESDEVVMACLRNQCGPAISGHAIPMLIDALPPDPAIRLRRVVIRQDGCESLHVVNGKPVDVEIAFDVFETTSSLQVALDLWDQDNNLLVRTFSDDGHSSVPTVAPGHYVARITIPADFLAPTEYQLVVHASVHNVRNCTGPGLRMGLQVARTGRVCSAYPTTVVRSKVAPFFPWRFDRPFGNPAAHCEGGR